MVGIVKLKRSTAILQALKKLLKELSHEIGMGYLWYGRKEPYLDMNL
jgi:hypothetical protein